MQSKLGKGQKNRDLKNHYSDQDISTPQFGFGTRGQQISIHNPDPQNCLNACQVVIPNPIPLSHYTS